MPVRTESIVKYNGDIKALADSMGLAVDILNENYAIMELSPEERLSLSTEPEIEYIEEQKLLSLLDNQAITASCITTVQREDTYGLTGRGVLIAILDSGIDYFHSDFRNADGTTRIVGLWDQNAEGTPPEGFTIGNEYNQDEINAALNGSENIPVRDQSGHGTAVTGVAAGNGRASGGNYIGGAPESSLLIVRLRQNISHYFTSDTNLMRGIKYAIDTATRLNMPLVINISYGTNQGSHDGSSLFEQYINAMADRWKTTIVIPTGNEGVTGKHFQGRVSTGDYIDVQFTVQSSLDRLSITMLKSFTDSFEMQIIDGTGRASSTFDLRSDQTVYVGSVQAVFSVLQPTPYNADQIITLILNDLSGNTLMATIWTIRIFGISTIRGDINMWLPVTEVSGANTSFLTPQTNTTLTIPSTVPKAVSVGGFDSWTNTFADFSGRGFTISGVIKPEICAPAVNVISTSIGDSYSSFTGTSFAGPITAGACALMMQWGIIQGNDINMYGQRLKAFLEYGSVERTLYMEHPNTLWGYGTLCLKNSLDYARIFSLRSTASILPPTMMEVPYIAVQSEIADTLEAQDLSVITQNDINGAVNPMIDENYLDFIIRYDENSRRVLDQYPDIILSRVLQDTFAVIHVPVEKELQYHDLLGIYFEHSIICGLLSNQALDEAGITAVKQQPNLGLTGRGTIICIADTGIDYTLDAFRYEDGRSKILRIWDQTIEDGPKPEGYIYGTEYTNEQINAALASDDPRSIVPSRDEVGHGTFLSSLIAGRQTDINDEGAAPDAYIIAVKLKPAKQVAKNYSGLTDPNINAYQSIDIINGIEYMLDVTRPMSEVPVIYVGLGSSNGAHDGSTYFERYLSQIATITHIMVVIAVGNEGDQSHHAAGHLLGNEDMQEVEFNVSAQTSGFFLNMWSRAPDRLSVSLITPIGDVVERRKFVSNERTTYSFILERTQIVIDTYYPEFLNGGQSTFIRILNPQQGLWRLRVYGDLIIDGRYNIWMPISSLWNNSSYFLEPTVETTVTLPATGRYVIVSGAYNSFDDSIYVSSGRGPNLLGFQRPYFVAPGVNVAGVFPGGFSGTMTGTSVAAAVTAGACSLVLQWAVPEGNDPAINTIRMRSYLSIGLTQRREISYPNNLWGYGELNLIESFRRMTR